MTHKFTLALNKTGSTDELMHAVSMVILRLVANATPEERSAMHFMDFVDADGNSHLQISALSLVVMRGKVGELNKFRSAAAERGLPCVALGREDQTMAVAVFGPKLEVQECSGRLSLWN